MLINDHEIYWNHVIEAKSDNKIRGKMSLKKLRLFDIHTYCQNCQLGFSSKMKVPQLGSAWLGTFTARTRSSRKIPARTHLYYLSCNSHIFFHIFRIYFLNNFLLIYGTSFYRRLLRPGYVIFFENFLMKLKCPNLRNI